MRKVILVTATLFCTLAVVQWQSSARSHAVASSATAPADEAAAGRQTHLEDLLLKGEYQQLIDAPPGALPKFQLAALKARAAKASFLAYVEENRLLSDTPSATQAKEISSLANRATSYYEAAAKLACTDYERMCLLAEWRILQAHPKFKADSDYLRSKDVPQPAQGAKTTTNARALRACFEGMAEVSPQMAACDDRVTAVAFDTFERAYTEFGYCGVPEAVYLDLTRSVSQYVMFAMPDLKGLDDDTVRHTIRWYVWSALVRPQPTEVERRVIEAQVKECAERIEREFTRIFPDGTPAGKTYSQRFLALYERTKNNRLVPYFKEAIAPYQLKSNELSIERTLKQITAAAESNAKKLKARSEGLSAEQQRKAYDEEMANLQQTLYYELLSAFTRQCRPVFSYPLPREVTRNATARANRFGVWTFTIEKSELMLSH